MSWDVPHAFNKSLASLTFLVRDGLYRQAKWKIPTFALPKLNVSVCPPLLAQLPEHELVHPPEHALANPPEHLFLCSTRQPLEHFL